MPQPPPGKGSLMIAVGIPRGGKMPPPPSSNPSSDQSDEPDQDDQNTDGSKASQKEAMVISGDLAQALGLNPECVCGNCSMFDGQGNCSAVQGEFDDNDRCLRYYSSNGEPDADDQGGPSDNDEDDQGPGAPPPPRGMR